ncbi:MAG: AAA family ATPase [Bacillaceae bacterium]|nr:AAA family ATPase [Bacillaceae bacterium]
MEVSKEPNKQVGKMGSAVSRMEEHFFVGREKELDVFRRFLQQREETPRVLNLYGTGGTGKTYLLHAFQRVAEREKDVIFLMLDSQDFLHSPFTLAHNLLAALESQLNMPLSNHSSSLTYVVNMLEKLVRDNRVVIAIDTYEKMGDMDRWIREFFLEQLPGQVKIILAGRFPLSGTWSQSPAWRRMVQKLEIKEFTRSQTRQYLNRYDIKEDRTIRNLWLFSQGHPLTLSLAVMAGEENLSSLPEADEKIDILTELTHKWLEEVSEPEWHDMLEAAAVMGHFDQSSLSFLLEQEISASQFKAFVSLSFIKKNSRGWMLHELIGDAIKVELQQRNPDRCQALRQRAMTYYYNKINEQSVSYWDVAQFFYHMGDRVIQSTFFQGALDDDKYIEHVGPHNFHEIEEYFDRRKKQAIETSAHFYNRETDEMYHYYVTAQHNKKESELIGADYVKKMGYDSAKLVKNRQGETLGLSIIVPINERTLPHLKTEPVSRAYFSRLSPDEEKEYAVREDRCAGWFIRMLDVLDPTNADIRSFLLYNLFPLLLTGGRIIVSTPIPFYQELNKRMGYQQVDGATHYDYGPDQPSPTYVLDLRGPKLAHYLKKITSHLFAEDQNLHELAEQFQLTEREKEIVKLILQELSNKEIAKQLHVTEITVKKHVSSILKKTGVKNRLQLMKRFM